jgi:hypothetical protein
MNLNLPIVLSKNKIFFFHYHILADVAGLKRRAWLRPTGGQQLRGSFCFQ